MSFQGTRIDTTPITKALRSWINVTGKSAPRLLNLAARIWVSFAFRNTTEAGAAKIKAQLLAKRVIKKGGKSGGKKIILNPNENGKQSRSIYRGTLAAAIVGAKVKKGDIPPFATPVDFYRYVRLFVSSRARSSGYHRSGYIPAIKEFKVKESRRRGGKRSRPPEGRAKAARKKANLRELEASFANLTEAYTKQQGDVLGRQVIPVARQLKKFIIQDLIEGKRRSGFK